MTVPEPVAPGPVDTVGDDAVGTPAVVSDAPAQQTAGDGSGTVPADTVPVDAVHVEPVAPAPVATSADFRMALVSSVTVDLPNQHPAVCLREMETPRRQLTFQVGLQDGVALSHAMRRIPTPRPLTHEVMTDVLQRFDIDLVAVRIVGRVGSVHFAELDLRGRSGRSVHACRPTDALILALHQPVPAPILIDARLLESGDDVPPPGAPA
jgi:bifunctional DNase/RNase